MTDTAAPKRRVHLAAHFPGVNSTTIWSDPRHGSQIAFDAFEHFARTAERGRFDYLFLAEGLRLREHKGAIYDLDVVGRPATLAVLAAVAAVTSHVGLVGTLSATFNEPVELARQLASLDWLSRGRTGWNVVTSPDAFTGENFRRGGYLPHGERYARADEFVATTKELWGSWRPGDVAADAASGAFLARGDAGAFAHAGAQFDIRGRFNVPRSPQGRPVIVQAGDSPAGRDFAAKHAEVIFSRHASVAEGLAFSSDVRDRLEANGRGREALRILPAATFAIGDTEAEARERAAADARAQTSPQTAIAFLERVWGRDLTSYDPDGPLPDIDPADDVSSIVRGRVPVVADRHATARAWRERAEAEGLSIRDVVIEVSAKPNLVGTPAQIAAQIDAHVQAGASDGFTLVGTRSPDGLDEFTERVIPELQERGVYRTEYPDGATLRELLELPAIEGVGA